MNIISTVNDKRFSINNIRYLKNYVTAVKGSKIEVFNCYERQDVLVPLTHYSNFMVDGVTYPNAPALQAALLPVLYSRSNLGGDSPDIDPDNIDIVRRIRSASVSKTDVLAAINNLEMYGIDDKQSLWFLVLAPETIYTAGRINPPVMSKYKMVNYGKGTYGADTFQLELTDLELINAAKAAAQDIELQPGTDIISFGSLTSQSVASWLRSQSPARNIQPQSEGYTLFKGSVNGIETTYLWLGTEGTHTTPETLPVIADFLALEELIVATNQDNIDIKKSFTLPNRDYNTETVLSIINSLPAYKVNENQSVWFVGNQSRRVMTDMPVLPGSNFSINPLIIKYKMLNKGKGTYGLGQTQLLASDIELVYSNEATLNDLESVPTTQIIPFTPATGQTVSGWLNTQLVPIEIQPQEDGYTIFKSAVAEDGLSYLWIGYDGTYGVGNSQSAPEDFELLNETIQPVIQNNVDVKKSFLIPNNYTLASILDGINSLTRYEITDTQSVWFTASQQPVLYANSITAGTLSNGFNPLILKYKLINHGKGWYGENETQLTADDIELVYANEATLAEMEQAPGADIVNITLNNATISGWLNTQNPPKIIQPQESGYTIFKDAQERAWLWTGVGGTYGAGVTQAIPQQFRLLNKSIRPGDQDNIDIKKTFKLAPGFTPLDLISYINSYPPFSVNEKQSVWFIAQENINVITLPGDFPQQLKPIVRKYKMLNNGKGIYGLGGTELTIADIELVYTNEVSLQDVESSAETDIINVSLQEGQTVTQWLNGQISPIEIRPQEDGYTIFKDLTGTTELSWLWLGVSGNYGTGELQSTDTDFQVLNDVAPPPFVPTLNQSALAGNIIYDTPVDFSDNSERLTISAQGIKYSHGNSLKNIRFETEATVDSTTITFTVPVKATDDVFAMASDLHKPVKNITINSEGFGNGAYTLVAEDRDKWLLFEIASDFIINIPGATFAPYTMLEGETAGTGQATFVGTNGIVLHYGASEMPKTAEKNSAFGLKFRSATDVALFGKLELL